MSNKKLLFFSGLIFHENNMERKSSGCAERGERQGNNKKRVYFIIEKKINRKEK